MNHLHLLSRCPLDGDHTSKSSRSRARVAKQDVVTGVIALDPERGQFACWRPCTGVARVVEHVKLRRGGGETVAEVLRCMTHRLTLQDAAQQVTERPQPRPQAWGPNRVAPGSLNVAEDGQCRAIWVRQ